MSAVAFGYKMDKEQKADDPTNHHSQFLQRILFGSLLVEYLRYRRRLSLTTYFVWHQLCVCQLVRHAVRSSSMDGAVAEEAAPLQTPPRRGRETKGREGMTKELTWCIDCSFEKTSLGAFYSRPLVRNFMPLHFYHLEKKKNDKS